MPDRTAQNNSSPLSLDNEGAAQASLIATSTLQNLLVILTMELTFYNTLEEKQR